MTLSLLLFGGQIFVAAPIQYEVGALLEKFDIADERILSKSIDDNTGLEILRREKEIILLLVSHEANKGKRERIIKDVVRIPNKEKHVFTIAGKNVTRVGCAESDLIDAYILGFYNLDGITHGNRFVTISKAWRINPKQNKLTPINPKRVYCLNGQIGWRD